jgi:hypothetical protein
MAPPDQYSVHLARVGTQWVPGAEIYYMRDFEDWQPLRFTMAVLRNEHRTVVVNTGFEDDFSGYEAAWRAWHPRSASSREEDERAEAALARLGVDPADVDIVVLSPFGGYATGKIDLFPRAEICFSRSGWERLMSPRRTRFDHTPAQLFPRSQLEYLFFDAWDRVRLLEDEDEIAPGLRSVTTRAHQPASLSLFISTSAGTVCYSDSFFTYRNVEERIPLGLARSLDDSVRSIELARSQADLVLPAYDPVLFERYPDGRVVP